jgi:hypothetical protein
LSIWLGSKLDPTSSHRTGLGAVPGTEISSAETGRRKPAEHLAETDSETLRKRESPEFRARTAILLAKVQTRGLGGGDSRARNEDPPASHRTGLRFSGERKFSMQRQERKIPLFSHLKRIQRLPESPERPHCGGKNAKTTHRVRYLKTGWWRQ